MSKITPALSKKVKQYAKCAACSYLMNKDKVAMEKRFNNCNVLLKDTPYRMDRKLTDTRISVMCDLAKKEFVIAHRGTAVDTDAHAEDLLSDLRLAFRIEGNNENIKIRLSRTIKLIEIILKENPIAKITLCGHSLGGFSAYYCMVTSQYVANNVSSLHSFNPGTTPLNFTKWFNRTIKTMDDKINHYHIVGDEISKNYRGLHGKKFRFRLKENYINYVAYGFLNFTFNGFTRIIYRGALTIKYHSLSNFY